MKFGIYLPNFGPYGDARALADLARDAENAGWDGFYIWDHIAAWSLPVVDPWVALAAIAVATQHMRIGTTVTPLPRRRPWKLAREAVSIDHLSGGRLTLGVGIGGGDAEWAHLGEQPLEIVTLGVTTDPQAKESVALVEQRAARGATWWLEAITPFRAGKGDEDEWPLEAMRERILQGPPGL